MILIWNLERDKIKYYFFYFEHRASSNIHRDYFQLNFNSIVLVNSCNLYILHNYFFLPGTKCPLNEVLGIGICWFCDENDGLDS